MEDWYRKEIHRQTDAISCLQQNESFPIENNAIIQLIQKFKTCGALAIYIGNSRPDFVINGFDTLFVSLPRNTNLVIAIFLSLTNGWHVDEADIIEVGHEIFLRLYWEKELTVEDQIESFRFDIEALEHYKQEINIEIDAVNWLNIKDTIFSYLDRKDKLIRFINNLYFYGAVMISIGQIYSLYTINIVSWQTKKADTLYIQLPIDETKRQHLVEFILRSDDKPNEIQLISYQSQIYLRASWN